MSDIDSTSSYGGTRVDEMLPPDLVAELVRKVTPPVRSSGSRTRRAGLTAASLKAASLPTPTA